MKFIKSLMIIVVPVLFVFWMLVPQPGSSAEWGNFNGWRMGNGMMGGWGMGWMMLAFWILVLIGLFLLIRWFLQITGREKNGVNGGPTSWKSSSSAMPGGKSIKSNLSASREI